MEDYKTITIPIQMFKELIEESSKYKAIKCIVQSNEYVNRKEIVSIINTDTMDMEVEDVF